MRETALTIAIPRELHQSLKVQAINENVTLKELCTKIFTEYINEKGNDNDKR